jgi:hypothetical protein
MQFSWSANFCVCDLKRFAVMFEAAGFGADVVGDGFRVHAAEDGPEEALSGERELDFSAGAVGGCEAVLGDHGGGWGFLGVFGLGADAEVGVGFGVEDAISCSGARGRTSAGRG